MSVTTSNLRSNLFCRNKSYLAQVVKLQRLLLYENPMAIFRSLSNFRYFEGTTSMFRCEKERGFLGNRFGVVRKTRVASAPS
jgi:hypothetical protein